MQLYIIILSVFLSTFLLILSMAFIFLREKSAVHKRLEKLLPDEEKKVKKITKKSTILETIESIGRKLHLPEKDQSRYQKMIVTAGFRRDHVWIFLGFKLLLAVCLPLIFILLYAAPKGIIYSYNSLIIVAILAIIGFLIPTYWLRLRISNRKREIFCTLPDVLDLMTVCVEAGLSMDAALVRVSEDPQFANNPLGKELRIVCNEIRAGIARADALKRMAERTDVDDLRSFVTMLIQTDKFGTSLSQALRVHADTLRIIRTQRAMEEAAKTAVKMIFPLVFLIFPALIIIILGPAFIIHIPTILETFK